MRNLILQLSGLAKCWRACSAPVGAGHGLQLAVRSVRQMARWSVLCAALGALLPTATLACSLVMDLGSSGVRAAMQAQQRPWREDAPFLASLEQAQGPNRATELLARALEGVLAQAGEAVQGCSRIAGGFSVWRLAADRDAIALAQALRSLHERLGLTVFVIPQEREGRYGLVGLQQAMGEPVQDAAVLDLGGGSLQLVSSHQVLGLPLGQRTWHAALCQRLKGVTACELQPMDAETLHDARTWAASVLKGWSERWQGARPLLSASRPLLKGVGPALSGGMQPLPPIQLQALSAFITSAASQAGGDSEKGFTRFLLSDMLITEALMRAVGVQQLRLVDVELTNVPGLLSDALLWQWQGRYGCYLDRLAIQGQQALETNPESCP